MKQPHTLHREKHEEERLGDSSPQTVIVAALIASFLLALCCYFLLK